MGFPFFLDLLNPINISTIAFPLIFASALHRSSYVQHFCSFLHKMKQIITSKIFSQCLLDIGTVFPLKNRAFSAFARGFVRSLIKREKSEMLLINLLFFFLPF